MEAGRVDAEIIGFVGGVVSRRAAAARAEHGFEAGEGFVELIGIAERSLEEAELVRLGTARFGAEADGDDGRFGLEIFEMRVEHPEKCVDVARGRRDREGAFVFGAVGEMEREAELLGDEVNAFEAIGKLIEKSAQDKKQRLQRFDFISEFWWKPTTDSERKLALLKAAENSEAPEADPTATAAVSGTSEVQ